MSSQHEPEVAFILSLMGGIPLLVGGLLSSMWFTYGGLSYGGMMGGLRGIGGMM